MALLGLQVGVVALACAGCVGPGWRRTETEHLVLYYRPGSYAQRNLELARQEYEDAYRAIFDQLPAEPRKSRYRVFLHETGDRAGWVNRLTGSVHYRFSEDVQITSSHEFMHLVLGDVNPRAPGRLEEGVCRYFEVRWITTAGRTRSCELYRLGALEPVETWDLDAQFEAGYDTDGEGNVAAACVAWLMKRLGRQQFWELYRTLTRGNHREELTARLGSGWEELQQDFRSFRESLDPPPPAFRAD